MNNLSISPRPAPVVSPLWLEIYRQAVASEVPLDVHQAQVTAAWQAVLRAMRVVPS